MMKQELSELERVKMENYTLRVLYMEQQVQQVRAERAAFVVQIENDHPGYEWSEGHGLVEKEELESALR
jgi:hypothetical protein